jgi:hypothetical protein
MAWIAEQMRAGGTYRLRRTDTGETVYPPAGGRWTRAEAKRELDRLTRDRRPAHQVCPVCHRRIDGSLLVCKCPPPASPKHVGD